MSTGATAEGIAYPLPSTDDFDPAGDLLDLANSLRDKIVIGVADQTARDALLSAISWTPTATHRLKVERGDTGAVECYDGTSWAVLAIAGPRAAVSVTASAGPTSGTTELTLATASVTTAGGQVILEFTWYNITRTVNTDSFLIRLYDGTTLVASALPQFGETSANFGSGVVRGAVTLTAGTHSITARLVRSSGTGTATLVATSATPALLTVTPA